jgi:hypothetical protein
MVSSPPPASTPPAVIFFILSIGSGIYSWIDYRREEVDLPDHAVRPGFRKPPSLRSMWRWYESWALICIVALVIAVMLYVEIAIIPLLL